MDMLLGNLLLQSLKKEKVLRLFKLNSGQDDHAIMFMNDYLNQVGSSFLFLIQMTCFEGHFHSFIVKLAFIFQSFSFVGFILHDFFLYENFMMDLFGVSLWRHCSSSGTAQI